MNLHSCVVLGCSNSNTSVNKPKSTCKFLNFPIERKDLTELWLRKLNLEGWSPGPESLVCEKHFSSDSFEMTRNGRVLKSNAIPTIVDELDRIIWHYEVLLRDQYEELSQSTSEIERLRCRLCTSFIRLDDAVDVYSDEENVIMKILKCIPNQVCMDVQDYLPKYVCRLCLSDLNTSYRMLIRASESEKFFCHLLAKEQELDNKVIRSETINQRMKTPDMLADLTQHNEYDWNMRIPSEKLAIIDSCISDQVNSFLENELLDNRPRFAPVKVNDINLNSKNDTNVLDHQIRDILNTSFFDHSPNAKLCTVTEKLSTTCQQNTFKCNERINESEACLLFTCQHCSTTYESKEILDKHLETHIITICCEDDKIEGNHTENVETLSNSCGTCLKSFPTQELLMQHLKSGHGRKYVGGGTVPEYKCKECGKKLKSKHSLTIHERIHTGARPYYCENCGKSFRSDANLIQHRLIHSGEKKYKCTVCHKAFVRKISLEVHTRVHTGEKPYQCTICKTKFTQVGDLHRHERKGHEASTERSRTPRRSSKRTKKSS